MGLPNNDKLKILKEADFQSKLDELSAKYENKKVLIYGAGNLFDIVKENFNIDKFNIIGISDKKFKEVQTYKGYKAYPPESISGLNTDIVLVTLENPQLAEKFFTRESFSLYGEFNYVHMFEGISFGTEKDFSTFVPVGHYYSPIPDRKEVEEKVENFDFNPSNVAGINLNTETQLNLLESFIDYYKEQPFTRFKSWNNRYYFENDYYLYTDALFLYSMIRHLKPSKIIEIGSGFSSAVTLDTNEQFFNNNIKCTFIEPYPDRLQSILKENDYKNTEIMPCKLQDVDLSVFKELKENDILFIDSTHVSKTFSDVNKILFDILPNLNKGVYIHFHDIFYPFEYIKNWLLENRAWNESYLLRAFLQYNNSFEIQLFSDYLAKAHKDILFKNMPLCANNTGGNLWIKKVK